MAAPVITSVVVSYPNGQNYLAPGQQAVIDISATDADNTTVDLAITVTDAGGNQATTNAQVVIADSLSFAATIVSGAGSLVQDPVVPSRFHYTA